MFIYGLTSNFVAKILLFTFFQFWPRGAPSGELLYSFIKTTYPLKPPRLFEHFTFWHHVIFLSHFMFTVFHPQYESLLQGALIPYICIECLETSS